jgi:hypothetical protein
MLIEMNNPQIIKKFFYGFLNNSKKDDLKTKPIF